MDDERDFSEEAHNREILETGDGETDPPTPAEVLLAEELARETIDDYTDEDVGRIIRILRGHRA